MKKRVCLSVILGSLLFASSALAVDLETVYQQALKNAPSLHADYYTVKAAAATSTVAVGALLPQANLSGAVSSNWQSNSSRYDSWGGQFTLTQYLFNYGAIKSYTKIKKSEYAASANYQSQRQAFITDVVLAYFAVRNDQESLRANDAKVSLLGETLTQIKARFKVGLSTYTDLTQAEANYNQALADQIKARNTLDDDIEQLRTYTGVNESNLDRLQDNFPYVVPKPANLAYWLDAARKSNRDLQAETYTTQAAQDAISVGNGAWLPTVSLVGTIGYSRNNAEDPSVTSIGTERQWNRTVALTLTWGLGTATLPNINQLADKYAAQAATQLQTYRQVLSDTKQAYLKVIADVSLVASYQQSVVASEASLKQLQAEYKVGSTTLVKVLNGVEQLFSARVDLAAAKHAYIVDLLTLKEKAGLLSDNDVTEINRRLVPVIQDKA